MAKKKPQPQFGGLTLRILADKREPRFCPKTGRQLPWPCLGLQFIADSVTRRPIEPPARFGISTTKVSELIDRGLAHLVNERIVTRPTGPSRNPYKRSLTFRQADELVFHAVDLQGQQVHVRYKIVRNPDKVAVKPADLLAQTPEKYHPRTRLTTETEVVHEYQCELIGSEPAQVATA